MQESKSTRRRKRIVGVAVASALTAGTLLSGPFLGADAASASQGNLIVSLSCPTPFASDSWTESAAPTYVDCTAQSSNSYPSAATVDITYDGEVWKNFSVPDNTSAQSTIVTIPVRGGVHLLSATTTTSGGTKKVIPYAFSVGDWSTAPWIARPANAASTSLTPTLDVAPAYDQFPATATYSYTVSSNADGSTAPVASGNGSPGFTLPSGTLQPGTAYYWKVTVKGPAGAAQAARTRTSPAFSFTTDTSVTAGVDGNDSGGGDTAFPDGAAMPATPQVPADTFDPTETTTPAGGTASGSSVQMFSTQAAPNSAGLPYANWRACGALASKDQYVQSYSRYRINRTQQTNTATLRCGDSKYGYFHILAGKMPAWSGLAAPANENWRDLAGWSISRALADPDIVSYDSSGQKWCYSRVIYLVNKKTGRTVVYQTVRVILGQTGQRIITAYPAGSHCGGNILYRG